MITWRTDRGEMRCHVTNGEGVEPGWQGIYCLQVSSDVRERLLRRGSPSLGIRLHWPHITAGVEREEDIYQGYIFAEVADREAFATLSRMGTFLIECSQPVRLSLSDIVEPLMDLTEIKRLDEAVWLGKAVEFLWGDPPATESGVVVRVMERVDKPSSAIVELDRDMMGRPVPVEIDLDALTIIEEATHAHAAA